MSKVTGFKSLIPPPLRPAAQSVYHAVFRAQLRARCWWEDIARRGSLPVALPPAMLRYRVSESLDAAEFLRIGAGCASLVEHHAVRMGFEFRAASRILDFGCGCGRTLRWLLESHRAAEFFGVDVDAESIGWCGAHLSEAAFAATSPQPPLPFPDAHFDLVYSISVFTHLDEAMQDRWLAELARILKPGGVLLFTVHGLAAAATLDSSDCAILGSLGILHKSSKKLNGIQPEWYQTTWHARHYIMERTTRWFDDVRYEVVRDGIQDVVLGRKANRA